VSFPEDKCYDDRFFTVFDDTVGVIARTGFRRFWKWLNHRPYIYSVIFTELWILCGGKGVLDLFYNNESYSATVPSIREEDSGCLSKHFDSAFNRISDRRRQKSFSYFLPWGEVIGRRNIVVIQASPLGIDHLENTVTFPPWRSSSDCNSNMGVLFEDFLLELFNP
jgi:hypothetical protein